jgi:DNA-binding beta-propeller fold protein YncE
MVVANGSLWVAGANTSDSRRQGLIARIDPNSNRVEDVIPTYGEVADIAVDDAAIWALIRTAKPGPLVLRIDPSSGKVADGIALAGAYGRSIFSVGGSVFAAVVQPSGGATFDGGTLVRIDPATNEVAGTFDLGTLPSVAARDGLLWAVTDNGVVQIDLATGEPVGAPARLRCTGDALAVGAGRVWCFDPSAGRALAGFDPRSGANIRASHETSGTALAASPGSVWVVNGEDLTRVDVL